MKETNILLGLMCQILHTRNSGAKVSDEKRNQWWGSINQPIVDWLIATEGCRWWHWQQLWYSRTTSIARNTYKILTISQSWPFFCWIILQIADYTVNEALLVCRHRIYNVFWVITDFIFPCAGRHTLQQIGLRKFVM